MPLRCLLLDDNDAFLKAARVVLQREGVTVVGVASSTAQALREVRALRPAVVLVDVGWGTSAALTLLGFWAGRGGSVEVIMMSARAETDSAELIVDSPAAGCPATSVAT